MRSLKTSISIWNSVMVQWIRTMQAWKQIMGKSGVVFLIFWKSGLEYELLNTKIHEIRCCRGSADLLLNLPPKIHWIYLFRDHGFILCESCTWAERPCRLVGQRMWEDWLLSQAMHKRYSILLQLHVTIQSILGNQTCDIQTGGNYDHRHKAQAHTDGRDGNLWMPRGPATWTGASWMKDQLSWKSIRAWRGRESNQSNELLI